MIIERLTPQIGQPFPLERAQLYARVEDIDGVELPLFLAAAISELETYAGLALLTQAIRVTWPEWPGSYGRPVPLPVAPVIDPGAVLLTADGEALSGFDVIAGLRPAIYLPGTPPSGRIVASYDAGFGDDAEALPADIAAAIFDQAMATFDARGPRDQNEHGNRMSPHLARIAARYRRVAL